MRCQKNSAVGDNSRIGGEMKARLARADCIFERRKVNPRLHLRLDGQVFEPLFVAFIAEVGSLDSTWTEKNT